MKQPALGKKILELRKLKGLTQEDLVEKCNINVRTIQRIEAGEVSPRSYTIKTILEALEVDSNEVFQKELEDAIQFSNDEISKLNSSWIVGIFYILVTIIGFFLEYSLWEDSTTQEELLMKIPYNIIFLIVLLLYLRGYYMLSKVFKINALTQSVFAYFIIELIIAGMTLSVMFFDLDTSYSEIFFGIVFMILLGISEIILGLGIRKLKDYVDSYANALGIAKIVNGALLISILFSPIAIFIALPILIFEVIFLYTMATNKNVIIKR